MNSTTSRLTVLQTLQALGGLTASLLASAWTLSRWGVAETLYGVAPLLLTAACVCAILGAVVLVAWVGRHWGAGNTLRGAAPWLVLVASVSMTLAGLAVLAATLQTYGLSGTVCTMTCLLWLAHFAVRQGGRACRYVRAWGKAAADAEPRTEPVRSRPVAVPVNAVTPVPPVRANPTVPRPGDRQRRLLCTFR
jgi:hypothetical protein